jgi:hypothetical protein|tara:strand:+ start:41 stop:673 length:633 start_codon:yes stop_codon:yes gene_type:complete
MAINPNTKHENRHAIYIGCSGSGKTQALKQNTYLKKSKRVLLWDIDQDHQAVRFESRAAYARAVASALKSGKGFRVAYSGADAVANFEWFCRLAWAALDGAKETVVVVEELADVSPSVAKATPEFGRILRKSRKFGGILLMTSQRGQEIPKTAYNQVSVTYVGQQKGGDIAKVAKDMGLSLDAVAGLQKLNFWVVRQGAEAPKRLKITPR